MSLEEIRGQYIQDLIESMRETMHDAPGVGLAAPQIGIPLQLVVIEDPLEFIQKLPPEQAEERERRPVPFHVLINPVLINPVLINPVLINPVLTIPSGSSAEFFEGCLSLSGYAAVVSRATQVRVECVNANAEPVVIDATGWYARILQHEIDHLNGVLYIDRMNSRSFATQDNHTRFWKDKSVVEMKKSLSAGN